MSPRPTLPYASTSSNQRTWPVDNIEIADSGERMSGTYFSARASALNASILSILNAGSISLRAMPVATSLAYVATKRENESSASLVLDPTAEEEIQALSRHVFGWSFGGGLDEDGELIWSESEGDFSREQVRPLMSWAINDRSTRMP